MSYFKVVGWGPFRLPGENRRQEQALKQARRLLEIAEDNPFLKGNHGRSSNR